MQAFFAQKISSYFFEVLDKNPFTNRNYFAIIDKQQMMEVIKMKVFYSVPADIDELIFAGETTVPSDR